MYKSYLNTSMYRNGSVENSENNLEYDFHTNMGKVYNVHNGIKMEKPITKSEFDEYLVGFNLSISKEIFDKALVKLFNFSPNDELSNYSFLSQDCSKPTSIIQVAPQKYTASQYVSGIKDAPLSDKLIGESTDSGDYSDDFSESRISQFDQSTIIESQPEIIEPYNIVPTIDGFEDEVTTSESDTDSSDFDALTVFEPIPEEILDTGSTSDDSISDSIDDSDSYDDATVFESASKEILDTGSTSDDSISDSIDDSDSYDDATVFESASKEILDTGSTSDDSISDSIDNSSQDVEDSYNTSTLSETPVEIGNTKEQKLVDTVGDFDDSVEFDDDIIRENLLKKSQDKIVSIADRLNIEIDGKSKDFLIDVIVDELRVK